MSVSLSVTLIYSNLYSVICQGIKLDAIQTLLYKQPLRNHVSNDTANALHA